MNRPDRTWNKLSPVEKEIGGLPNSGETIIQDHAAAIERYIENHIGLKSDGNYSDMYFNRTLSDWARFNINDRTKHDASISSGLAIMACNKTMYHPSVERSVRTISFGLARYDNSGSKSEIIK